MLKVRGELSIEDIMAKSLSIEEKLFELEEFKTADKLLFFVSFKNEVRTESMIKESLKLGKKVVVPITNLEEKKLELSELKDYDLELGRSGYGILEPKKEFFRSVDISEVDLVVMPGLAFDKEGNRLGYGGGYYDRLLSDNLKVKRVAICFDLQIIGKVVVDGYDVKVDKIVTEREVVNCI